MTREQEIKEEIRRVMKRMGPALAGYKVVLFGSRANGTARKRSDFDVGIIGTVKMPLRMFYAIEDLLERIDTLYSIDWVDLSETTECFRNEALKKTEVLYG